MCADLKRAGSVDTPLFTCEWDPQKYMAGMHEFTLTLEEEEGSDGKSGGGGKGERGETFVVGSHSFSLDGTGERNAGFVGMFLGLPLIQWALTFMVSGVCVATLYMLILPQVYGLAKDWISSKRGKLNKEEEGGENAEDSVERLLARRESPYRYFVKEGSWARTALLVFWPTVTTFQTMSRVPIVQLISSAVACAAPLVVPLAFGPAGPSGMCVFMGWGWTYCRGGVGSIEFFMLLVTGCYYYMGVVPCLLVTGAQVRIIQAEEGKAQHPRSFGRKAWNAIFEFWCFAVSFLFDAIFFFFFLITSGTLTAFMTPCVKNKQHFLFSYSRTQNTCFFI